MLSLVIYLTPAIPSADTVRVVTSIKPVHSLAAMVLDGIAEPYLIVRGANSPHGYAMRPSDAQALAHADAVFWIGPAMETFLTKPLESLSGKARVVALLDDDDEHGAPHVHEKQGEHGQAKAHEHGQAKAHDHGDGHDHGGIDPHVWLDPEHAAEMVERMTETMIGVLPAQASRLTSNRDQALAVLQTMEADVRQTVEPYKSEHVVVLHDAYGHFTRHFGLEGFIALTVNPEHKPGPGQIREVRREIKEHQVRCVFAEPQFPDTHINLLIEGSGAKPATMDPLGADLTPGAALYPKLLLRLAASFRDCLAGTS